MSHPFKIYIADLSGSTIDATFFFNRRALHTASQSTNSTTPATKQKATHTLIVSTET